MLDWAFQRRIVARGIICLVVWASLGSRVHADQVAEIAEPVEESSEVYAPSPVRAAQSVTLEPLNQPGLELMQLRLEHRLERRRAGFWLLGWGVLNTLAGGLVIAIQHDDPAWRMAGAMTASFGVINAALSFGLLDRRGARQRQILDGRLGVVTDPEEVREAEIAAQLRSGQVFALNLGLDVVYMTLGALLFALGQALDEPRLNGAGLATAVQGGWLFAFDVVEWRDSNARARALAEL